MALLAPDSTLLAALSVGWNACVRSLPLHRPALRVGIDHVRFSFAPLPYFPSRARLKAWWMTGNVIRQHLAFVAPVALRLCAGGDGALITGVCIGWFSFARYWGKYRVESMSAPFPRRMDPLAMVVSPSAFCSAVGLIALSSRFPVTMADRLRHFKYARSYIDVARDFGRGTGLSHFPRPIRAMPSISSVCSWDSARRF